MSTDSGISPMSREGLALEWYKACIFLDKTRSHQGKGFRLKLHETNPNAPLSPFYLNFRLLRSFPLLIFQTAVALVELSNASGAGFELVADVPTAATPLVTLISFLTWRPMITPREVKTHGAGAAIDGVFQSGQTVGLFDDLCTQADSKLAAIKVLEAAGLKVVGVYMLLDRQQGGFEQLKAAGYNPRALWTITDLLDFYKQEGVADAQLCEEIRAYLFPDKA